MVLYGFYILEVVQIENALFIKCRAVLWVIHCLSATKVRKHMLLLKAACRMLAFASDLDES